MNVPLTARGVEAARAARRGALVCRVDADARGVLDLGVLEAEGPDAASFLHSQVTNEVSGLAVGQGNLSARVTRTGHLVEIFSLHRVAEQRFWLVCERSRVPALRADLDHFLFADRCTLVDRSADWTWVVAQGPAADQVAGALGLPRGLEEGACAPFGDGFVLRRSLGGDPGWLAAGPRGWDPRPDAWPRVEQAGGTTTTIEAASEALEILRIEAGFPRVGPDTPGKDRRLHETGLEQQAVSYRKGCFLGQEVIARARTYGSVPRALRALVLAAVPFEGASAALAALPDPGGDVVIAGSVVGQVASRTWSPWLEAPVALAYLDRDHRTPGTRFTLAGPDGPVPVEVRVLPLFRAADQAARVAAVYDRAIRVFASGQEEPALRLLEEALRLDPSFADGYEAVGVILGRSGRWHEAIDVFRRLEEVAPDEPMVNTNLSLYFMKLGDKVTAEAEAGRATEKSFARVQAAKSGVVRSASEVAHDQRAQREADARRKRDMFRKVLTIDPEDTIALFGLGNALSVLGEWADAERHLLLAVRHDKKNSAIYLAHGKALEALDRRTDAIETYRRGMEVASARGDLMPLKEMEHRVLLLGT